MKNKYFVFTLDLESEISGILQNNYNIFTETSKIKNLFDFLQEEGIKTSIFVVTEILNKFPEIIKLLQNYKVEFHCHSHTHNSNFPDSEEEIINCIKSYKKYFNKEPIGYRAPQGKISNKGFKILEKYNFKFDSSIFPSYYPNPLKYFFKNKNIHKINDLNLIEIPVSVIPPFNLIINSSNKKILTLNFYRLTFKLFYKKDYIIYASHLHDFFHEENYLQRLPLIWKFLYSINKKDGISNLKGFISFIKKNKFKSIYISELYNKFKDGRI